MPKNITSYRILLSMPSDLENELECAYNAVDELNLSWGRPNNKSIELIHWKKESIPGASIGSTQNLINEDIGTEFDLYIGILWKRFGTPTDNASSGTEEEFNNAYNQFQKNLGSNQILFYFCNIPFTLDEVDITQLKKVADFKDKLKEKNVLFQTYDKIEDLAKLLRLHIPARLNNITEVTIKEESHEMISIEEEKEDAIDGAIQEINLEEYDDDDLGIIEYREIFDTGIATAMSAINRITKGIEIVGKRTSKKTEQMDALSLNPNPSSSAIKGLMRGQAKYMDDYSSILEVESSIYYTNMEKAINAGMNIIALSNYSDPDTVMEERRSIYNFLETLQGSIEQSESFVSAIKNLPRMTIEINKAKKRMERNQLELISYMRSTINLLSAMIYSYDEILKNLIEEDKALD